MLEKTGESVSFDARNDLREFQLIFDAVGVDLQRLFCTKIYRIVQWFGGIFNYFEYDQMKSLNSVTMLIVTLEKITFLACKTSEMLAQDLDAKVFSRK